MALKVKAVERLLKFDKESAGKYRYVMKPEMYSSLTQAKVIREAALRSGVSQGVMKACWDAAGAARTGYDALRAAKQGCRGRERREDKSDYQPSYYLHSLCGFEGRVGRHRHPDHLF